MTRIEELIKTFNLVKHPEGGYYSETYRSNITIPGKDRSLMTSIYFLLTSDSPSHFHRIKSDEIWFFHEGSALTVHMLQNGKHITQKVGIRISQNETPQFLVPANTIFGSSIEEKDSYAFVSCVVAPGFDFNDFELFDKSTLLDLFPTEEVIITKLTRS
jgi:uncharacterized protein